MIWLLTLERRCMDWVKFVASWVANFNSSGDLMAVQLFDTLRLSPIRGAADDFTKFIGTEYEELGDAIRAANIMAD